MQKLLEKTQNELKLRNYSPKTIQTYCINIKKYLDYKKNNLETIDIENIKKYLLLLKENHKSPATTNLSLNSLKFFYRDVLQITKPINIKTAKKPKSLPIILTRNEINTIINVTTNHKHKLIIALAYGSGLRVSEVTNLKLDNFNLNNLTIHIKCSKGQKDRLTILPQKLSKPINAQIQKLTQVWHGATVKSLSSLILIHPLTSFYFDILPSLY